MLKAGLFIIEMCFSILKSNIEAYMTYLVLSSNYTQRLI